MRERTPFVWPDRIHTIREFVEHDPAGDRSCLVRSIGEGMNFLACVEELDRACCSVEQGKSFYNRFVRLPSYLPPDITDFYGRCYEIFLNSSRQTLLVRTADRDYYAAEILAQAVAVWQDYCMRPPLGLNGSVFRSLLISALYWFDTVMEGATNAFAPDVRKKIVIGNCVSRNEYLFAYLMTLTGCDVLLMQSQGDIVPQFDALGLSQKIMLGHFGYTPIPTFDRSRVMSQLSFGRTPEQRALLEQGMPMAPDNRAAPRPPRMSDGPVPPRPVVSVPSRTPPPPVRSTPPRTPAPPARSAPPGTPLPPVRISPPRTPAPPVRSAPPRTPASPPTATVTLPPRPPKRPQTDASMPTVVIPPRPKRRPETKAPPPPPPAAARPSRTPSPPKTDDGRPMPVVSIPPHPKRRSQVSSAPSAPSAPAAPPAPAAPYRAAPPMPRAPVSAPPAGRAPASSGQPPYPVPPARWNQYTPPGAPRKLPSSQLPMPSGQSFGPAVPPPRRQELSYEALAALASSVVMILIKDRWGKTVGSGSGIMVGVDGYILTNHHVIAEGASFEVRVENEEHSYPTQAIIKRNSSMDLALIRIERTLSPLFICRDRTAPVRGQRVVAIGSPMGLFNTVSDGIVSGIRTIDDLDMIQFTAPISGGSSGGALLNMYGEVIGLCTAGIDKGQNLNLAVGSEYIRAFLGL